MAKSLHRQRYEDLADGMGIGRSIREVRVVLPVPASVLCLFGAVSELTGQISTF